MKAQAASWCFFCDIIFTHYLTFFLLIDHLSFNDHLSRPSCQPISRAWSRCAPNPLSRPPPWTTDRRFHRNRRRFHSRSWSFSLQKLTKSQRDRLWAIPGCFEWEKNQPTSTLAIYDWSPHASEEGQVYRQSDFTRRFGFGRGRLADYASESVGRRTGNWAAGGSNLKKSFFWLLFRWQKKLIFLSRLSPSLEYDHRMLFSRKGRSYYSTFYGLIGERFCKLNRVCQWTDSFEEVFKNYYTTIHRYETTSTKHSPIFLDIFSPLTRFLGYYSIASRLTKTIRRIVVVFSIRLWCMQEMMEGMGLKSLAERFKYPEVKRGCEGMFPMDVPKNTRFYLTPWRTLD